ncbi:hypothetical protein JXB27_04595 [Candidatus Woesearchaeota archaeon]|nr:hypothetical protein [Candidatus Woesearchaeota archaeon]
MIKPKLAVLMVFVSFLIPVSYAIGLAMPPSKHFDAFIGDEFFIDIMILNQEGVIGNYSISFDGALSERAAAKPPTMIVYPPLDVLHRGNPREDGYEGSRIYINSSELTPGTYDLRITASVSREGSGALNLIQKVTRNIEIEYNYPPSFINKAGNFIYKTAKGMFGWLVSTIKNFYAKNKWLNYLFALIILTTFFYAGIKAKIIKRCIDREIERIRKHGFWKWLWIKIKDIFKKKERQDVFKDNEKKEGFGGNSAN